MHEKKCQCAAVILAGGLGVRFGNKPKIFEKVSGKAVILYSLEQLNQHKYIDKVIITASNRYRSKVLEMIANRGSRYGSNKIEVIKGGATRQMSAWSALKHLVKSETVPKYVVFHDAARPLITKDMISAVVNAARKKGGGVIAAKTIDLLLETENSFAARTFSKDLVLFGHTPQCFRFPELFTAFLKHMKSKKNTKQISLDNIDLILKYAPGIKVELITNLGPSPKVTYREDLATLKTLLLHKRK